MTCFASFINNNACVAAPTSVAADNSEFTSRGLEFLAQENQIGAADVLRKVSLEHLFRVGASLSDRPKATRE